MDRKSQIEEKVFSYIREHHMLEPQDSIVAGISGGADSICLLYMLIKLAERMPITLSVVHVNHGIRIEAEEDLCYVESLCEKHGISFYPYHIDVRKKAEEDSCSEEEAGRNARYQAFSETAELVHANKIAVAHNKNDCSETMLFHLFRGSGVRGLSGISPVRGKIIRPILCLERKEIEAYLEERGISYCHDRTNEEDSYTRNRIRHHILPYADREIVKGCVGHMAETAELFQEVEDYLTQQTETAMTHCVRKENVIGTEGEELIYRIVVSEFATYHRAIQKRILYQLVVSLSPQKKDITQVHIRDLHSLFQKEANRDMILPFGIVGQRRYGEVMIMRKKKKGLGEQEKGQDVVFIQETVKYKDLLTHAQTVSLQDGTKLELTVFSANGSELCFPQKKYTKFFDYDKIEHDLVIRTRKMGDYLTIAGQKGQLRHKSVKDYMITEKIPREERDTTVLLAEKEHILWLLPYRMSEYYKVSSETKNILQVKLI